MDLHGIVRCLRKKTYSKMSQAFSVPCEPRYRKCLEKAGIYTIEDVAAAAEKPSGIGKEKWKGLVQACTTKKKGFKAPKNASAVTDEHTWFNKTVHIRRKGKSLPALIQHLVVENARISLIVNYYVDHKKAYMLKTPSNIYASYERWLDHKDVSDDSDDEEVKDPYDPIFNYTYDGPRLPRLQVTAPRNLLTDAEWDRVNWIVNDVNELISE